MHAIKGTWTKGKIVLNQPADWPEGCAVVVEPVNRNESLGIREADWPTTPEGIANLLATMDLLEPIILTAAEEAAWQAGLKADNDYTIAHQNQRIERLFE